MIKKTLKLSLTLLIGGVFLWLAFRNVKLTEVWHHIRHIHYGWIVPFAFAALFSHILRAERWRLLIEHDKEHVDRVTLVSGVLTGYMLNLIGPRFGEVARPVYVAKREELSSSKLIGTIVLERMVDLFTMILLMIIVSVYLISDISVLSQIFGKETIDVLMHGFSLKTVSWILASLASLALLGYLFIKTVRWAGRHIEQVQAWINQLEKALKMFKDGILSAREVKNWWLFLILTVLMWGCYTLMTYIPFWMFNMQDVYHLGILEAITITVISAIGIAIPSLGGIGTYHYFVKQSLFVLFAVPAATGLAYATVTHVAMVVMVSLFTPVALAIDKFRASKTGRPVL